MLAGSTQSLSAVLEAGARLSPELAVYGDAWWQPGEKAYGADVGARVKKNLDVFAGGWGTYDGRYSAQAGLKWRF